MVKGPDKPTGGEPALDLVFDALGSGVRRQLLARLRRGPLAVGELLDGVAVSGPAVSKHLKALEAAGLVARSVDGRQHRIRRVPGALGPARAWLAADAAGAAPPAPARPRGPAPVPLALAAARAQARELAASLSSARLVVGVALGQAAPLPPVAAYRARLLRRRLGSDPGLPGMLREALAGADALAAALPGLDSLPARELEALSAAASRCSWLLTCHPALADLGLLAPAA